MGSRIPPTPSGPPIIGNTLQFGGDTFEFIETAKTECGDVFGLDLLGREHLYILASHDHAEQVLKTENDAFAKTADFRRAFGDGLVTVEGETWKQQRQRLQPYFYRDRIESYTETIVERTRRRLDTWNAGEQRNISEEMSSLALEVLFATLFGRDLTVGGDDQLRRSAAGLNGWFKPSSWALPEWVPTPARRRFRRSVAHLRDEVDRILDERERTGAEGDDLLSKLVRLGEHDGLSRDQIKDQVVTFTFAGHETTAKAMTFAWYLLATNPNARDRFHHELETTLGGADPTASDLAELSYTERVLQEAMRLYPPVHTIPRRTTRPVDVGEYHLPEGSEVHLSTYLIHRDDRVYDEPLAFRPDRWTDENAAGIPNFAHIPFGGGQRLCIGREFALTEAKAVFATIGQRYRLEWPHEEPLSVTPEVTTHVDGDAAMAVHNRTD